MGEQHLQSFRDVKRDHEVVKEIKDVQLDWKTGSKGRMA